VADEATSIAKDRLADGWGVTAAGEVAADFGRWLGDRLRLAADEAARGWVARRRPAICEPTQRSERR
jgi:hypothetical protein